MAAVPDTITPGNRPITVYRGIEFSEQTPVVLRNPDGTTEAINLSGYTGSAEVRDCPDEDPTSRTLIASFTVAIVDAPNGVISYTLDAAATTAIADAGAPLSWDLWLTNGTHRVPLLVGKVSIGERVTA